MTEIIAINKDGSMNVIVNVKAPLILTCFLLFSSLCLSAEKNYKFDDKILSIYTPKNWQSAKHFMGSDLKLLGPYRNGRRPVIALDSLPLGDFKFDKQKISHNHGNYIQGRKDWLLKNNGRAIEFFDYKMTKWKHINEVHMTGYKYVFLDKKFIERTYFFKCKGTVYNLNSLFTDKELVKNQKSYNKILNSIKCK